MIPLTQQLSCVLRELALRRNTYPKWVAAGRMKQAQADLEIERMKAVCDTLLKMVHLEEVTREILSQPNPQPEPFNRYVQDDPDESQPVARTEQKLAPPLRMRAPSRAPVARSNDLPPLL